MLGENQDKHTRHKGGICQPQVETLHRVLVYQNEFHDLREIFGKDINNFILYKSCDQNSQSFLPLLMKSRQTVSGAIGSALGCDMPGFLVESKLARRESLPTIPDA
jgi:hypothetical protein